MIANYVKKYPDWMMPFAPDDYYEVDEWCPNCGMENAYIIDANHGMWQTCKTCGKPLLMCSMCYDCDSCPF